MALVTMPDGQTVDMPDNIDAATGARLRALANSSGTATPAAAPAPTPAAAAAPFELPSATIQKQLAKQYAGDFANGGEVQDMSAPMRALGSAKASWDRAALGLKGMVMPSGLSDEDKALLAQGRAFDAESGFAGGVGTAAADAVPFLAGGGLATQALRLGTSSMPLVAAALTRGAGQLAAGAGIGAATSPDNRKAGATGGALGSAVGVGVNRLAGGLVAPAVQPEARALMDQGVQPTIGQAIGGTVNSLEQQATSVPFVGPAIKAARARAVGDFNQAAINIAAPGVQGVGDEAVLAARDAISQQYTHALGLMPQNITVDAHPIIQAAVTAADDPALALSATAKQRVYDYVEQNLLQRQTNITPDVAKRVESDLGAAVRNLTSSSTGEDRAVGQALQQVQGAWRNSLTDIGNAAGNDAGTALRQADASWRAFMPVDRAASSAVAQSGEDAGTFSPRILRRSIEALDKSQNNNVSRAISAGTAPSTTPYGQLNQLTRLGEQVLPNTVPDSGTAGRVAAMTLGGFAAAHGPAGIATGLGASAALNGLYTRFGQRAMIEGIEPAVRVLLGNGATADQIVNFAGRYGPDAVLGLSRGIMPAMQGQPAPTY